MEQFDQLLTCAICLDRYRNPKLLPCQHSFCMEPCMEGLINYVTRQVKCPECRAEHRIPYQGIQQYPTNVTLQRFLELHIEITGELPDPTLGQTMERCGVCSEKNYCSNCSHCDKKVCAECKEAHMEIIKREIARVNNQIRRSIHRLQDALSVVEKNATYLQQNCASVTDEIDEIYRRLSKALKDRTDYLKGEVEIYLAKEMSNLTALRENLEQEITNFNSNADFADKHMTESSTWEDNELMDAKDILLKTMEFIRNFETESGDYNRRVRFNMSQDSHQLAMTLGGLGELTINAPNAFGAQLQPPSISPGLMRSKSDHRVAAQFRQAEERYLSSCGSDTNEGRTSPLSSRRYFGEPRPTGSAVSRDRYGSRRNDDYDFDSSGFDLPSDSRKSRFRSRFMRNLDAGDSDNEPSSRSVRFHEQDAPPQEKRKERERVLDTEDVTRGPLSGVTRFLDSPRVLKRLQEFENKDKRKDSKPPAPVVQPAAPKQPVQPPAPASIPGRRANRQVSEEDEIAKIKKQNKSEEAAATSGAAAAAAATPVASKTPVTPTVDRTRKTSGQTTTHEERSHPSTPTSPDRPKFPTPAEKTPASRTASSSSTERREEGVEDPNRRRPGYLRSQSERQPDTLPTPKTSTVSLPAMEPVVEQSTARKSYSRTSSSSSVNQEDSDNAARNAKVGKLPPERLKSRSMSTESSSSGSSTRSSPVRNTGAAFSTEELKSRYTAPTTSSTSTVSEAPRSRYGRPSIAETTNTPSSTSSTTSTPAPRFQSRFLGRAGTPSAEVSKVSESSSGSSSESESESEDEDEETSVTPKVPAPETPDRTRDRELARTDIGPLLARSAQARDSFSTKDKEPAPTSTSTYTRTRPSTLGASSPSTLSPPATTYGGRPSASEQSPSRYGTDSSSASSSLARSRTGSSLARDDAERYPLASKYLNRSRPNMTEEGDSAAGTGSSSSATPRYGGYRSRFLNRSRSSAALASENDGEGEQRNGDYGNQDSHVEDSHIAPPATTTLSGEERYPSGRSRYAALKERRSRLARSKSSHDVGPDDNNPEEPKDTGNPSLSHLSNPRPYLRSKSREVSPEHGNANSGNGDGSSLSTWARYLKSKYNTRSREPQDVDDQHQRRSRSRPSSAASNHDSRAWSPDELHADDLPASPSVTTSFPRHQYLQKRHVQLKFGMRGAEPGCFTWPRGVAVGPDNTVVVADSSNHRVQVFDHQGQFLKEFGQYGNGEGEFDCLAGVAVNRIGQYIIADRYNHRIQVFDPSGRFLRMFGVQGTTDGKFSYPWGITTDALGFIYVCDKENHRVQVFQSDGTFVGKFGSLGSKPGQLEHPHYIAVSSINRVIVSDSNNHRIQIFDVNGNLLSSFGGEGAEPGQFKFPRGVAVDDQGYIIVADSGNNRIQIFTPEGAFLRAFGGWGSGDGEFKGLEGIAVMSNGSIVVCDRENHRIQLF